MCHLYPYNNVKLLRKFFFTLIYYISYITGYSASDQHSHMTSLVMGKLIRIDSVGRIDSNRSSLSRIDFWLIIDLDSYPLLYYTLYYTVLYMLYCIVYSYYTILCYIILYTRLYYTVLCCAVLYYTILYTILYYILYYTIYYTIL